MAQALFSLLIQTMRTGSCHLVDDLFQVGGDFIMEFLDGFGGFFIHHIDVQPTLSTSFSWDSMEENVSVVAGQAFPI